MRRIFVVAVPFIVTGCFSLSRVSPPLEQYVLGSSIPSVIAPATDSAALTIGMRRLDLAPYLTTPAIIVRRGALIETSEFRRWGEDPAAGISRGVARYLRAAPRIAAVDVAPWSVRMEHDYLVQLHVTRMEGIAPLDTAKRVGEAHLLATWEIIRPDGVLMARGETERRESGWHVGDYAALVALLDKGLAGLAADVQRCLARLSPISQHDSPAVANQPGCSLVPVPF